MSSDADTNDLAADLRIVVGQLVRRFRADGPLPSPQTSALSWLIREGAKTTSQLAALERVRPQSMAHTVAELETAGLVARRPDPDDGRQYLVDLTPEGRELMDDYRRRGEGWVAAGISESFTSGEREDLARGVELLTRLVQTAER
ncbi:MAG TPA: MarR family transcriptional regulator [Solirubrobacterales bacterium]|nr:MarR family transcriptional regulator [Solirubrobacterales bacterium]